MRKYFLILVFSSAYSLTGLSQQYDTRFTIDSLKKVLSSARDTQRINILNKISELYFQLPGYVDANYVSAEQYADNALQLSKEINYKKGVGLALFNVALVVAQQQKNVEAIELFIKAIPFLKEFNENRLLGICYEQIAGCIHIVGKNEQAIEYFDSCVTIFRNINDTAGIIRGLAWKGHSYFDLGDYKNAYRYGEETYELAQKINDTVAQVHAASHLSNLFLGAGMPETVLEYMRILLHFYPNIYKQKEFSSWEILWGLLKAGEAYLQLGNIDSAMLVAQTTGFGPSDVDTDMFLGNLFNAKHQYDNALLYFKDGFKRSQLTNHAISLARHANGVGQVYLAVGNYDSALYYANRALLAAQSIHALLEMKNAIGTLTNIYDKVHNYTKAYHFNQLYKKVSDSLAPEEYKRKLALIEIQHQLENQKQQAQLLATENQLQIQKSVLEKERAKRIQTIAIAIMGSLIIITIAIMMNIRLKRKKDALQKKQLQQELEVQTAQSKRVEADFKVKTLELESQALRAQMNPHFIFNCLSSINRFILINKIDEASDYLTKFSRLIRMALHNSEKSLITLESELEALRLYLDLERLRFKNAFNYSITFINMIDINTVYIPPMLIQPFAENAIWHGLMHKKDIGCLEIQLSTEDKTLTCVIMDNGIGRNMAASMNSRSAEKHKSMGVEITAGRLALLNKCNDETAVFNIEDLKDKEDKGCGTKVILTMPYKELTEVVA